MEKEYTSIREALSGSLQDCIPRFFILMAGNGGWKTDTILGTWRRLLEGERETQSLFIISHLEFQGKRSRTLIRK